MRGGGRVSDDILSRIDESMRSNAARFDPFGNGWDGGRYVRGVDEPEEDVPAPADDPERPLHCICPDGTPPGEYDPRCPTCTAFAAAFFPRPRVHPASPFLTREELCGPDPAVEAFREVVREQGLTGPIEVEALRLCRNCDNVIVPSSATSTGWTHGNVEGSARGGQWVGVRCPGRLTGAQPDEPTWEPVTDIEAGCAEPLTVTMQQGAFTLREPLRRVRFTAEQAEARDRLTQRLAEALREEFESAPRRPWWRRWLPWR